MIARGLNRTLIFRDHRDRREFIERLAKGLQKAGSQCYAWVLMPNHLHLLLCNGNESLSELMRRLLTGYAVYFNHRHKRCGHLFQNRYKSILCQKDSYLLELVRYIHLNPVRAGMIPRSEMLDKYPWSGHSVLVGIIKHGWQAKEEILACFDKKEGRAVSKYRDYIKDGWAMGERRELTGGGLVRSAGGWKNVLAAPKAKAYMQGDERVLGESKFVDEVLKKSDAKMKKCHELCKAGWNIERLVQRVCKIFNLEQEEIKKRARGNRRSQARSLIAFWGYYELRIKGRELARYFNISQSALSESIERGRELAVGKSLTD
ncbi:transposase [bacterium]|nr:transposase [bacterium]